MTWYVWKNRPESINILLASSEEEAIKELGLNPDQVTEDNFEEYPYEGPGCSYGLLQGATEVNLYFVEKVVDITKHLKATRRKIQEVEEEYCAKIEKEQRRKEYLKLREEFGKSEVP